MVKDMKFCLRVKICTDIWYTVLASAIHCYDQMGDGMVWYGMIWHGMVVKLWLHSCMMT